MTIKENNLCAIEVKEIRLQTGLTQTEFGKLLGIPMRTIQNWETGQRKCPEYVVELIRYRIHDYLWLQNGKKFLKKE